MESRFYVYAYDKVWKDWICCQCKTVQQAVIVRNKWESFKDRKNVEIETFINPKRNPTMYEVTENGTIVLKKYGMATFRFYQDK